jgi:peptide/nickel transport system ATP-binding protein
MPLLEVSNLRTYFRTDEGEARAVDGVSFTVEAGEVVGIVGESGSGKSVTSLSILRLIPEPPGRILPGSSVRFKGEELVTASEDRLRQIRGNDIAMIFQEPMTSLNPVYTVGAQIMEALRLHRGLGKREARERAIELLRMVGIADPEARVDAYPHQLSGGMRQRVMIAMALSCEPDLLIADEPTTALDVTIQAQILELLRDLQQRLGMAMILITHDLGVVAQVCDRVLVMYAGEVVEEGSVEQIFRNPRHPYTQGLLQAIPRLGQERDRLATIPGAVPSALAWPTGCRFHPRCPYGWELTAREHPELFDVEPGHRSRCWLERYPERREEVDRTTGGFAGVAAGRAGAPAEEAHREAASAGTAPPAEAAPPEAPPRPLSEHPEVEKDIGR